MFNAFLEPIVKSYEFLSIISGFLADYAYYWLPFALGAIFIKVWLNYIRLDFINSQKIFLVEIKLPREIEKTPLAMETFLHALWQKPASHYIEGYWLGKVQPWFSLELVSIGGQVRFFIWGMDKYRNIVEAQLYAQYPDTEIYETQDYTAPIVHDLSRYFMWATYFKLTEKDVYPIKTYVDYGLDRENTEEPMKVDPITAVLEFLGSLQAHEQVWIQILVQGHVKRGLIQGHLIPVPDWTVEAKNEIARIRKEAGIGEPGVFGIMTKGESAKIEAIERSIGKHAFDTIIRAFYITSKPDRGPEPSSIPGLIGVWRQFSSNYLNGFKLGLFSDFDYPWLDFKRIRRTSIERKMLRAYKLRSGFQIPFKNYRCKPFILTTEELATLYHFPGRVARTPTLSRIESRRSEAPPNLPI